jgi:hypothetical protein
VKRRGETESYAIVKIARIAGSFVLDHDFWPDGVDRQARRSTSCIQREDRLMRYICLVHAAPDAFEGMSPAEKKQLDRDSLGYDHELDQSGHFVTANALQPPESAVLVRVRQGNVSTTDGPFIETKEQLAGFILIEARDLNEAIRIASGIPMAKLGTIEVRAVLDISGS